MTDTTACDHSYLERDLADAESRTIALEQQLDEAQARIADLESKTHGLSNENQKLMGAIQTMRKERQVRETHAKELRSDMLEIASALGEPPSTAAADNSLRGQLDHANGLIRHFETRLASVTERNDELIHEVSRLGAEIRETNASRTLYMHRYNDAQHRLDVLRDAPRRVRGYALSIVQTRDKWGSDSTEPHSTYQVVPPPVAEGEIAVLERTEAWTLCQVLCTWRIEALPPPAPTADPDKS